MAASPPFPSGYHLQIALGTTYFWAREKKCGPEMNFNNYVYFYSANGRFSFDEADLSDLRKAIANPDKFLHAKMDTLMMVDASGRVTPAHLPNTGDVIVLPEVQKIIPQLEVEPTEYEGPTKLIPKMLVDLIDPKPVIPRSGPIYPLTRTAYNTEVGCLTDAFQILHVRADMSNVAFMVFRSEVIDENPLSRYHIVRVTSENEANKPLLDRGSSIILWNARRITRPSFEIDFNWAVKTHNPLLVIITEARVGKITCEMVINQLNTTMSWKVKETKTLCGGTLVMWDAKRVEDELLVSDSPNHELRVLGRIEPIKVKKAIEKQVTKVAGPSSRKC